MKFVKYDQIYNFIKKVLIKNKVNTYTSISVAKSLSDASLRGIDSHGIRLLSHYLNSFIQGRKNKNPKFKFTKKFPTIISLDADHASGIAAGFKAIEYGSKYAKKYGMCGVSVFNSSHPGALSSITLEAIKHKLICIGFANADNLILSPGGKRAYFGTNPISIVAPMSNNSFYCLDMAMSKISWNKLMIIKDNNHKLNKDEAADKNGIATLLPNRAKSLLPIGDYKGFALASAIEMMCSIYSGMPFGINIDKMFEAPMSKKRKLSQFYILIRTDGVVTHKKFIRNLKQMSDQVRKEPFVKNKIMMPNDIQQKNLILRKKKGIPVDIGLSKFFDTIANKNNIKLKYLD
jgi:ureidoglycolate dehydrogenase (NAD+)